MTCPDCGPTVKAWEAIATVSWQLSQADHARYSVLTIPHPEWSMDRLRRVVAEVIRCLRKKGYWIEAAYVMAEFAGDTGYHVDLYSYGDYIDQKVWQDANRKEIVNVQEIKARRNRTIGYAFKETLGYAFKETEQQFQRHLELNGGKLYRTTRGFYGDLTRREAEVAARAERIAHNGPSGWKPIIPARDQTPPKGEGARLARIIRARHTRRDSA